jgi:hypothetical protein
MPNVVDFLKDINIAQLIAIGLMIWFCYNRMDLKIEKIDKKIDKKIDDLEIKLTNRIDKLDEKLTDVDRRLCRLEGAFASKDCCMIKDDRQLKKAE